MSDAAKTDRPHVLVVEDDVNCRDMIQDIFEEAGMTVTAVASAEQAVVIATSSSCDVVISDISLGAGRRDGIWLRAELQRQAPAIPVIAVTGWGDRVPELRTLGYAAIVVKPLILDDLVAL